MRHVPCRRYWWLAAVAAIAVSVGLIVPSLVLSYSVDDKSFYDGCSDMSAFDASKTIGIALDSQGGIRLQTDGATQTTTWTSNDNFRGIGVPNAQLEGQLTAETTGTGSLKLRYLPLALDNDPANPVLRSTASSASPADSYEVQGPSVVKIAPGDYRMYYTGVAADGYVQRVFEATSTDGISWAKKPGSGFGGCVLDVGAEGEFDEYGLVRPAVTYCSTSTIPFKMWYGGLGRDSGAIGFATSMDGQTWVKWTDPVSGEPAPVVSPGIFGAVDGYSVGEPSVAYNPATKQYHMYYVGSPSREVKGRAVGTATSSETTANSFGSVWSKGGLVEFAPAGGGNFTGGWFSPGVWEDPRPTADAPYWMVFAGKKAADQPYKLMTADSTNGSYWQYSGQLLSQNSWTWDSNNVFWASMLPDPLGSFYRIYYTGSGGSGDRARNVIGYATATGPSNANSIGLAVSASPTAARFDANQSAQATVWQDSRTGILHMLYAGRSGMDLQWRIGLATSTADATAWATVDGTGDPATNAVMALGGAGSFDESGTPCASVTSVDSSTLAMAYEGISAAGERAIGIATTTIDVVSAWDRPAAPALQKGAGFDAGGVGHPSLVRTPADFKIYYSADSGTGPVQIGVATAASIGGPWVKGASVVLPAGAAGSYDELGAYDPVVGYDPSSTVRYRMWYTAEDASGEKRVAYAYSVNGTAWTKAGLAVVPSGDPWAFDECGVRAGGVWRDPESGLWHLFYDGIDRGNLGNSAGNPIVNWRRIAHATGRDAGYVNNGGGTYLLTPTAPVDATGYKYEFRDFSWIATAPAGSSMNLEISFFPGYQMANGTWDRQWSPWAPVDGETKPRLPLTTEQVRWRVSMMRDAGVTTVTPTLDEFKVMWAPTHFRTSGSAVSTTITPTAGKYVSEWSNLEVAVGPLSQNASASATLLDLQGRRLLPPVALNGATNNVISLAGVDPSVQCIRVRFDLATTDGHATPIIRNWKVTYVSTNRAPVGQFQAFGMNQAATITWIEPEYEGMESVKVLRSTTGFPDDPMDPLATVVCETSATAGAYRSIVDPNLTNGSIYYYAAYTRDAEGWSPPAKSFTIPTTPLSCLTATAGGGSVSLTWLKPTAPLASYRGVTVVKRETTTPVGPEHPNSIMVVRDCATVQNVAKTITDAAVTPGTRTFYAAYIHNSMTIGATIYDAYSMPATASVVPLWQSPLRFDAMGYSGGAYVTGWVPGSVPTCTVVIRKKLNSIPASSTDGELVFSREMTRGQEITYTASGLLNLRPYWFSAFVIAKTSEGVTLTSPPARAGALPRTVRLAGLRTVPGDRRNTLYWTKPANFYNTTYKYYYSGVKIIGRPSVYPYNVTDPLAKSVFSGTSISTAVSASDLYLTNLVSYRYRGYVGVKLVNGSVIDYDYGYPSVTYGVPKYTPALSASCIYYSKIASPYYYYAYGRNITLSGSLSPNHYKTSTGSRGYVRVYFYVRRYNSSTRRYYWAPVKTQTCYLDSYSRYRAYYRGARGYYMLKAYFPGDGNHLPKWSTIRYARIY